MCDGLYWKPLRIVSSTQDTVPLCFRSTLGIARVFVSFWEQLSKLEFFLQFDTSLPCSCPVLPSYQVFAVSPPHTWRRYVMVIALRKVTTPVWRRSRICIKEEQNRKVSSFLWSSLLPAKPSPQGDGVWHRQTSPLHLSSEYGVSCPSGLGISHWESLLAVPRRQVTLIVRVRW